MKAEDICSWCGHYRRLHPTFKEQKHTLTYSGGGPTEVRFVEPLCKGQLPDTEIKYIQKETYTQKKYFRKYITQEPVKVEEPIPCGCAKFVE